MVRTIQKLKYVTINMKVFQYSILSCNLYLLQRWVLSAVKTNAYA